MKHVPTEEDECPALEHKDTPSDDGGEAEVEGLSNDGPTDEMLSRMRAAFSRITAQQPHFEGPALKDEGPALKDDGPALKDDGPALKDVRCLEEHTPTDDGPALKNDEEILKKIQLYKESRMRAQLLHFDSERIHFGPRLEEIEGSFNFFQAEIGRPPRKKLKCTMAFHDCPECGQDMISPECGPDCPPFLTLRAELGIGSFNFFQAEIGRPPRKKLKCTMAFHDCPECGQDMISPECGPDCPPFLTLRAELGI